MRLILAQHYRYSICCFLQRNIGFIELPAQFEEPEYTTATVVGYGPTGLGKIYLYRQIL